ncbi:MAG TPA: molybdopterin-dependent oxidoreductase, partial [Actinomycetota bacterium]
IAEWSRDGRVAFLSGGRLPDEDAYALAKLARVAFGTNDLDHRRTFHGGHAELLAAASPLDTTYRDMERAKVILVAGLDAEQEVPILNLRIRKAARRGAAVFVIHPRRTRLWDVAEHTLCLPEHQTYVLERIHDGDAPSDAFEGRVSEALRRAAGEAVVLVGERLTEHPLAADVALTVAQKYGARMALVPRRAGDRGALRAGVHPSLLPGGRRVSDQAERAEIEGSWGSLPAERGRPTRQILESCANREIDVLFLIGIDPLRDIPDADLVRRALSNTRHVVVQSLELGSLEPFADAFLPAAAWIEREGHATDWEGRSQPIHPVRGPAGVSRADWEIFAGLAEAMGRPLGFGDLGALRAEAAPLLEPRSVTSRSTAWTGTGRPQRLGDLTLLSYSLLVDEGRLSEGADELKAALGQGPFVELHPEDADKRGLVDGGRATVTTDAGEAVLDVRVTEHVAQGAAFVPFNQPGLAANELLSGSFTTAVRIQSAVGERAVAEAEAAIAEGAA